jgi:hypothetical protein
MKLRLLLISFLFYSLSCSAQEKIDTDRPDQTESAFTVPKGYFQAEFGFNKENTFRKDYTLVHPSALFKYGFKKMELRLETTLSSEYEHLIPNPKWSHGLEPVEIGFKAAICEQKGLRPKVSLIMHTTVPFISSGAFKDTIITPSFRFCMQHTTGERSALGVNFGASWDHLKKMRWNYTIAEGFDISDKFYFYVEAFGSFFKGYRPEHSLDAGLAYYISHDVKADISAGKGISSTAPKSYVALGFSFRVHPRTR